MTNSPYTPNIASLRQFKTSTAAIHNATLREQTQGISIVGEEEETDIATCVLMQLRYRSS